VKTKTYVFTEIEVFAIRDALIEKFQADKNTFPKSPIFIEMKITTKTLKEQFIDDARNWR